MKKIIIIDGGPRKNFNTASMLQKFAEGARAVSNQVELKTVRLYDLYYKGCMSCMDCKIKGKAANVCKFKDAVTHYGSDAHLHGASGLPVAFVQRL